MCWRFFSRVIDMRTITTLLILTWTVVALADDSSTPSVNAGKAIYSQTCIACHGGNGKGTIPGVRDLTAVDGPLTKSDQELLKSISDGVQSPGAPLAMPAKGGNPALTDEDIEAVIVYLRSAFGTQ